MERLIRVVLVMSLFMAVIPMGLAESSANSTGSSGIDVTKMTPTFKTIPAANVSFPTIKQLNVNILATKTPAPAATVKANTTEPKANATPAATVKANTTEAKPTTAPVATVKANTTEAKPTAAPVATVKANTTEAKPTTAPVATVKTNTTEAKPTTTNATAINATATKATNTTAVANVTASLNSTVKKQ